MSKDKKPYNYIEDYLLTVEEMKLIMEGKIQARNAEDFINEL